MDVSLEKILLHQVSPVCLVTICVYIALRNNMLATVVYSTKCLFLFEILIQSVRYQRGEGRGKSHECSSHLVGGGVVNHRFWSRLV